MFKYKFKKVIEYIFDMWIIPNSSSLQDFVSCRSYNDNYNDNFFKFDIRKMKKCLPVLLINNIKFILDKNFPTIYDDFYNYDITDLKKDDIVLDIGGATGGFSLRICNKVRHVYCVEPFTSNVINKNCELNNVKNVTVFNYGLGNGKEQYIRWNGDKKKIKTKSLADIIKQCGGHVDFIKCDCEGGEWNIKSYELIGIRRIEVEVHSLNGENMMLFIKLLRDNNYNVVINHIEKTTMMVHAHKN